MPPSQLDHSQTAVDLRRRAPTAAPSAIDCRAPLAEHLDQALLLLDERVDAGGLAVEVVGDGALLLERRQRDRQRPRSSVVGASSD